MKQYTKICKCSICKTDVVITQSIPATSEDCTGLICDDCENNLADDDWTDAPQLEYKKQGEEDA